MKIFGKDAEGEDYDIIYNYDIEDSRNYENIVTDDIDDKIESIRGTIGRGKCMICGSDDSMIYEGNICFICNKCGGSVHEDIYYRWLIE